MTRKFARVKGVAHSFVPDIPDVSLCGALKSSRAKSYDEPPKGAKKCKECEKLWKKAERDNAVVIEMRPGDRVVLRSGAEFVVEEVDEKSIYCRKQQKEKA
jgi:hypothetical protein